MFLSTPVLIASLSVLSFLYILLEMKVCKKCLITKNHGLTFVNIPGHLLVTLSKDYKGTGGWAYIKVKLLHYFSSFFSDMAEKPLLGFVDQRI